MVKWNPKQHSTQDNTRGFTPKQKDQVKNLSTTARAKTKVVESRTSKATNKQGNGKTR